MPAPHREDYFHVTDDLDRRIRALELSLNLGKQKFEFASAAPPWDLGKFDGDAIQGVRIAMHGIMNWGTAQPFIAVQPNGLSTISSNFNQHRHWWSGAAGHDVIGGYALASRVGMVIGAMQWSGTGAEFFSLDAVVFTKAFGGVRLFRSDNVYRDGVTDGNRILRESIGGQWTGSSDPITSLALVQTGGSSVTFTGRITTEVI